MNMNYLFVPYTLAVELKKLNFDERCLGFYSSNLTEPDKHITMFSFIDTDESISAKCNSKLSSSNLYAAPLWQQVLDWLRKKHNIHVNLVSQADVKEDPVFLFIPNGKYSGTLDDVTPGKEMYASDTICLIPTCDTYEQARETAILEAIKLIKQK